MKQLAYMRSSWSHFKGIMHLAQRLLCEEEQSIPMKGLRLIPKVSIADQLYTAFCSS